MFNEYFKKNYYFDAQKDCLSCLFYTDIQPDKCVPYYLELKYLLFTEPYFVSQDILNLFDNIINLPIRNISYYLGLFYNKLEIEYITK